MIMASTHVCHIHIHTHAHTCAHFPAEMSKTKTSSSSWPQNPARTYSRDPSEEATKQLPPRPRMASWAGSADQVFDLDGESMQRSIESIA